MSLDPPKRIILAPPRTIAGAGYRFGERRRRCRSFSLTVRRDSAARKGAVKRRR
jgi:hypothetical protein